MINGVEVLRKAIDGLAAPQPEVDGVKDPRPAATRRAHALVSALEGLFGRRAIKARDRGCVWDGCDRPVNWCDIHQVNWWVRVLGETNVKTGALFCVFHRDEMHKSKWQVRFAADGHPELIPPPWIDPQQKPRRNKMHHLRDLVDP